MLLLKDNNQCTHVPKYSFIFGLPLFSILTVIRVTKKRQPKILFRPKNNNNK